jgi:hypothetical protein
MRIGAVGYRTEAPCLVNAFREAFLRQCQSNLCREPCRSTSASASAAALSGQVRLTGTLTLPASTSLPTSVRECPRGTRIDGKRQRSIKTFGPGIKAKAAAEARIGLEEVGMSRSAFAVSFADPVGMPPMHYARDAECGLCPAIRRSAQQGRRIGSPGGADSAPLGRSRASFVRSTAFTLSKVALWNIVGMRTPSLGRRADRNMVSRRRPVRCRSHGQ